VNALVYGWYGHGNVGDELMRVGMTRLLQRAGYTATFTDKLLKEDIAKSDIVIIGGGCVLYNTPKVDVGAEALLFSGDVPVAFISVGFETQICDFFERLLKQAMCVLTRSPQCLDKIRALNPMTEVVPDIAYSVMPPCKPPVEKQGVLFIPNAEVMPRWNAPHWKHLAWDVFRSECAQFLEEISLRKINVTFMGMCCNNDMDDAWAAAGIVSMMQTRSPLMANCVTYNSLNVSDYGTIITQRYHGIVVAEAACVPYLSIDHHNKLTHAWPSHGRHLSYYGSNKQDMLSAFDAVYGTAPTPIERDMSPYDRLVEKLIVTQKQVPNV
jgi:polysaccharide pyruvyl transferase WcaK-like protein